MPLLPARVVILADFDKDDYCFNQDETYLGHVHVFDGVVINFVPRDSDLPLLGLPGDPPKWRPFSPLEILAEQAE